MEIEPLNEDGRAEYDRAAMINDLMVRKYALESAMSMLAEQSVLITKEWRQVNEKIAALEFDESDLPPETEF